MTEKEKAAMGVLYDANHDPDLFRERLDAKCVCYAYNRTHPAAVEERTALIWKLFGKTGETFVIEPPFACDYGYNTEIGENFFVNHNCIILDGAKVTFGDHVFIGPHCGFYTAGHPLDAEQRNQGLEYAFPVTVGNNVWIGGHVVVLPGATIGDNCVIGAGSVVTKDIPAGMLAVGNPCRVLRPVTEADRDIQL
ncbi:MAG: sugar O-acetyltransferase [Tannerellaceae bacterium]|nr:sugar O-acetyltransferase [Tannerellaceae bacterium]